MTNMIDGQGRHIDYLRISVTDRCNFRCHYCMPEKQKFLPHADVLDYSEIALLANRFIAHGIRKIRLTGGGSKSATWRQIAADCFNSEVVTEGKVQVNEDRSTPIFSPYAGRVTRLLAKAVRSLSKIRERITKPASQ